MRLLTITLATLLVWAFLANVAISQPRGEAVSSAGLHQAPLDVLVVAPHSDDEAIGCTVVMLRAIKEGKRVGVVVVTNGDGFPKAAAVVANKPQDELTPRGFHQAHRHTSAAQRDCDVAYRRASGRFGLSGLPGCRPQAGLCRGGTCPISAEVHPEEQTYGVVLPDYHSQVHGRPAPYIRASVVGDLTEIIKTREPKEIYVTNEADSHGEHQASFWIVRDAVRAAEWHGTIFTYLVHGHTMPKGPVRRLRLTADELEKKRATIEEYAKHLSPIHDKLAEKFAKPEEVFWPIRIE